MIFQALLDTTVASASGQTITLPVFGKCNIKVVRIDYLHNATGGTFITPYFLRLTSDSFMNTTLLSRDIQFYNVSSPFFNNSFVIEGVILNGYVKFNLTQANGASVPTVAGGLAFILLTLDIEMTK